MEWQHIVPINDLTEHTSNGHDADCCSCGPRIDVENFMVIHAAMDRREVIENRQREIEVECSTSTNNASLAIALMQRITISVESLPYEEARKIVFGAVNEWNSATSGVA